MRSEQQMVSDALEVQPALLPYIPELLADLEELGSDSELIVEVLRSLPLHPSAKVIDLGCGKGATCIKVAADLGYTVLGVELFEPFVEHSRLTADRAGVAKLCTFLHGDIVKLIGILDAADAVVFAALGNVLGSLTETMRIVRQFVKPRGFMIVSDPYVAEGGSTEFNGFDGYASRDETIRRLTAWGDILVKEIIEPGGGEEGIDEAAAIHRRALEIAARHPELDAALREFAESQGKQCEYMDDNLVGAIWVLQRS